MRRLIGITGAANSGKDTAADYIINKSKNYSKISFADPLKHMLIDYFGLTYQDVYTTEGKNNHNKIWNMTNRQILQKVGTDAMRKGFDFNVWVKLTQIVLMKNKQINYIIADVRFDNQAQMIKNNNGFIFKIIRQNYHISQNQHQSQIPINEKLVDFVIDNNGTFQQFYKNIDKTMNNIGFNI